MNYLTLFDDADTLEGGDSSLIRHWLCRHQGQGRYGNGELELLGLRSLLALKQRHEQRRKPSAPARRSVPAMSWELNWPRLTKT